MYLIIMGIRILLLTRNPDLALSRILLIVGEYCEVQGYCC